MIGILYESDEWSDHKLATELEEAGLGACLLDMEDEGNEQAILTCGLLVSRVFASAGFRGHTRSLARMPQVFEKAQQARIPVLNPAPAHSFETSKEKATRELGKAGLSVPAIYACGLPHQLDVQGLAYPCVIKPDCGGRTTFTTIVRSPQEAQAFLRGLPGIPFVVEEYIEPEKGFLTRVEMIGFECALILKRSIAENGLSTYHLGSTYEHYLEPSAALLADCALAARTLSIELGSFDVIEHGEKRFFIDANAVSNVSEDCTELFGFDLMQAYARYIAARLR